MGRATQGVRVMNLAEGEKLVSIARLDEGDEPGDDSAESEAEPVDRAADDSADPTVVEDGDES